MIWTPRVKYTQEICINTKKKGKDLNTAWEEFYKQKMGDRNEKKNSQSLVFINSNIHPNIEETFFNSYVSIMQVKHE